MTLDKEQVEQVVQEELSCQQRIDAELASRAEDFELYYEDAEVFEEGYEHLPPFHEYGLCFEYVEPLTFKGQNVGYYCYQLSYGGPSDEIRFHPDGTITYHFMDWFDGAHRYITNKPWAKWLREYFTDIQAIDWASVADKLYDYGEEDDDDFEDDIDTDDEQGEEE